MMPGRTALLAVVGAAALAVPAPAAPAAAAAPACSSPQAAAPTQADVPWPQKRYAPERLEALATGVNVTVAVIDSGVDARHPQLAGRVLAGRDYLDGRDARIDCAAHGTAVASIIAARPREGAGPRGLAPDATILPVRVSELEIIEGEQSGRTVAAAQFAQSIRWAVDHGADVLNLSVVLYRDDPAVRRAVAYAIAKDVVVVAAAGNLHERSDPVPYPAAYDGVIGVGSIGPDGTRSSFSQVGPYVDLVAPGGDVDAAAPVGGHQKANGTSYAAPFVSATAALIREYRPDLPAAQVAARILATTDPAPGGKPTAYGAGVLNPFRAVTDTVAAAAPRPASTLRRLPADSATLARAQRREESRENSLRLAAAVGGLAGVAVLVAVVLPRGAGRRWRPAEPD
ncbi:MAG TPA: type VII secretion-associated serine protease mycosin [Micromonosporaceae bacterium]|nr:type VII secretion-associated serine protease mycosin [Micromonosporaceae bacterium]